MTALLVLAIGVLAVLTWRQPAETARERLLRAAVLAMIVGAGVLTVLDLPGARGVAAAMAVAGPVKGRQKVKTLASLGDLDLYDADQLLLEQMAITEALDHLERRWSCTRPGCNGRPHGRDWTHRHARASQRKPTGKWTTWLMLTGRGWGKTRTAAEAVREWVNESDKPLNIAVIGKKETLVREVCFQHRRSGLLAVFPEDEIEKYDKSIGSVTLTLKNGSVIRGFGANEPDNFRGYEFDKVWGDEYAAWNRHVAQESLDTIWFCLRESANPQIILSTTPKPLPHIKKLIREHEDELAEIEEEVAAGGEHREPTIRVTRGKMSDNRDNLSDVAGQVLDRAFANTRMGAQELDGDLLEDVEGALWASYLFEEEGFRIPRREVVDLERIVIGVDPAVTSGDTADENGICVAGRSFPHGTKHDDPRPRGFVLHSEARRSTPRQTMQRVADLYHAYKADQVILEANNGGEYLATVLEMVDPTVSWRIISATRDKRARAAPVAALYEQGRIHHAGPAKDYDKLETSMTTYVGEAESKEKSPDILDAAVWALTDLFLDMPKAVRHARPRDRRLKGRR
jgi:phage terminase large subunit-like protein